MFRIDQRRYSARSLRNDGQEYFACEFDTIEAAEKRARYWLHRFGREVDMYAVDRAGRGEYIATVLQDALGRTWTQVTHEGGRFI